MFNQRLRSVLIFGLFCIYVRCCLADDVVIQRPSSCDRQETLLKNKHEYTYRYTITTSSSVTGASKSASGSKIACTVTVSVPRKCELMFQLSDCDLKGRNPGEVESYSDVEHADVFAQELERFPVYFQMNKGIVLEDSIIMANQEPIHIANLKRGLISRLQFPYMNDISTKEEKDVFGSCPVEYTVLHDTPNTVRSKRNLRTCTMPQIFKKRFPFMGESGGFKETNMLEAYYPFVSEVDCDYTLGDDKTLKKVECFQQQYFYPNAYKGDILATAMANVSQTLELESFKLNKQLPRPNKFEDGHIVQLKFDFGNDHFEEKGEADILSVLMEISDKFEIEDYEMVPGLYGDLLWMVRGTTLSVLVSVKDTVFHCEKDCTTKQTTQQKIFLDSLSSCGTANCQEVFLDCMQEGRVDRVEASLFLQKLASSENATESLLKSLLHYCKSVDSTSCWLSLGTLLGKTDIGEGSEITLGVTLGQTLDHISGILKEQCSAPELGITEREMIKMIKTMENIGHKINSYYNKARSGKGFAILLECIKNDNMPKRVHLALLQLIDSVLYDKGYVLPSPLTELLFTLLKDVTKDTTLRATTFTVLMKTVDKDNIKKLVQYAGEPNTRQLKAYMTSNIQTLLENGDPTLKPVWTVWEEVKREDDGGAGEIWKSDNHFGIGISKTINFAHFFKLPITEYLGAQLYADIIFDPSSMLYSRLKLSLNYYHGDQKYNVFEISADIEGFDLLLETLLGRNDLNLMQLYGMYKQSKGQGQGDAGTLYDKFDKNMIKKVVEILEQVNHPKFPDFEFAVDLKMHGKHVHFLSLKDLMTYVRQMKAHAPPDQPPMMQKMIGLLKRGIHDKMLYGVREFAGLNKQMPTCAGLPMNMTVRANVLDFFKVDFSADMSEYLKKTGPITANWKVFMVLAVEMKGQLTVPVAHYHSAGVHAEVHMGFQRHMQMGLTYSPGGEGKQSNMPFSGTLQLDIWNVDKEPETVVYAKGIMMMDHHSGPEVISRDPALEKTYQRCFPDWLVAATGRSLCANFVYPDVKKSRTHAYFPLSGPFELEWVLHGADPEFDVHNLIWKFEVERKEGVILRYIYFTLYGKGSSLHRLISNNMTYNSGVGSLDIDFAIPEAGIKYTGRLQFPTSPGSGFEFQDFVWMSDMPYLGYFLKGFSRQDSSDPYSNSEKLLHANVTLPWMGAELMLKKTFINTQPELTSDLDLYFTYYCSQEHPLCYIFHLNPLHAAKNSDITHIHITNHAVTTVLSKTENKWKADDTLTVKYPGQTVTMVTNMKRNKLTAHRNSVITYYEDDQLVTVTMTADATHNKAETGSGMDLDYNMNVDGDDFDIVMHGKFLGDFKDFNLQVNADYTKSEVGNRKKRSLEAIYDMFKAVEKAAVDKIVQIEEAIIGKPEPAGDLEATSDQGQEKPSAPQLRFPPMPQFPSIWDISKWTATLDLTVKAQPVFREGQGPPMGLQDKGPNAKGQMKGPQKPGQGAPMGAPKGLEFVWSMEAKHPWNGGYRLYDGSGKFGKNMVNNLKHFHYWVDIKDSLHYTDLEGADIDFPQFPNPIERSAHFHIQREAGHIFDTQLEAHAPMINASYLIYFDFDSITHHKPLLHVKSTLSNQVVPFLNHEYEEYFTYEPGYAKHTTSFSHKLLTVDVESSFDYRTPEWLGLQNGSVTIQLPMLNYESVKTFSNKFIMKREPGYPRLTTTYTSSTYPGRMLVYETVMQNLRSVSVHQYIETDSIYTDRTLAWHATVDLLVPSSIQVTFEWEPIYDQALYDFGVTRKYQVVGYLQLVAEMIKENMGLPIKDKKFIIMGLDAAKQSFLAESPKTFIMKYIFPKAVFVNSIIERTIANFVMLKHRQALLSAPGPYIPPRFRMLLKAAKAAKDQKQAKPSMVVYLIEKLAFYGVKGSAALVAKSAGIVKHHLKTADRKMQFAIPLIVAKDHFMQLPRPKQFTKHVYILLSQLIGKYKDPQPPQERVAVIYGRRDDYRPLNILTFDNEAFQIPADLSDICSYLLMADVARRDVAVMATPMGVSLVTKETAVVFGFDKTVYINDCKVPVSSSPVNLEGVTVTTTDAKASASTSHGITLTCYKDDSDVCTITWLGSQLNGTVGLLGTNNYDEFTDRRVPDGSIADSWTDLLPHYVVSGPEMCHMAKKQATEEDGCNVNVEVNSLCFDLFSSTSQEEPIKPGSCEYFLNNSPFKHACIQESHQCDTDEEAVCHTYQAYTRTCEQGKLDITANNKLPEVCSQPSEEAVPTTGSLDIVFVVSQHSSMAVGQEPWEYLFGLVSSGGALPYRVRFGVVGFAGEGDSHSPYVVKQDGSYFTNLEDIDWASLESLTADGKIETDGFDAIKLAATFPFSPTANRMIVVLTTKEQTTDIPADLDSLKQSLADQNIIVNVFSTYRKLSSKSVIGIDWEEKVISRKNNLQETKNLPQNDYIELVKATQGAVFDILTISRGRTVKIEKILEHFTHQVTQRNADAVCPAA